MSRFIVLGLFLARIRRFSEQNVDAIGPTTRGDPGKDGSGRLLSFTLCYVDTAGLKAACAD